MTEANSENAEPQASVGTSESMSAGASWWGIPIAGFVFVCLTVAAGLYLYHQRFVAPNLIKLATVDVAQVLEIKQMEVSTRLLGQFDEAKASESYDELKGFGPVLDRELSRLKEECACVLVVSGAVVQPGNLDLTPVLMQRLGLANLDANTLKQRLIDTPVPGVAPGENLGGMKK